MAKLAEGANPATIRIYVAILSALFNRLLEDGKTQANPALSLPKSVRRLMKPTHDPRTTPFLERLEDVRRVHLALPSPLKDKDSRVVPVLDSLHPILAAWQLETGGASEARVIPSLRCDGGKVGKHTPGIYLRAALKSLGLVRDGLGWYECNRHTFASQWVMAGGSIEKLKEFLGHYSVVVTERYAHLGPEHFAVADHTRVSVELARYMPGAAEK